MFYNIILVAAFIKIIVVASDNDYFSIYDQDDKYNGQMFPQKYLSVEDVRPTMADFSHYVKTLRRIIDYFGEELNDTDPSVTISSYFMKGVLKRTLIDYNQVITDEDKSIIKYIVNKAEDISSYYMYSNRNYGPHHLGFRFRGINPVVLKKKINYFYLDINCIVSKLFTNDESLVYSIGTIKKDVIARWITSNVKINDFIEQLDNMTLPREKYVALAISTDYYLGSESDFCLSSIPSQPIPLKKNYELKPCRSLTYCRDKVFKMPSVTYALSHQYLYILGLAQTRRCYVISEEADMMHMEIMCANMYREAVYLARRGFFYRDLFLEHIAFCGMLGFEEVYRRSWFQKAASWVDEDGCVAENRNFIINRTRLYMAKAMSSKERKVIREKHNLHLYEECQHHQMALMSVVLAHGIRYAAYHQNMVLLE